MPIALFLAIAYYGPQTLHCSHETLHLSTAHPMLFTQILGMHIYNYVATVAYIMCIGCTCTYIYVHLLYCTYYKHDLDM